MRNVLLLFGLLLMASALALGPAADQGKVSHRFLRLSVHDSAGAELTLVNHAANASLGSVWRTLELIGKDGSVLDRSPPARDLVVFEIPGRGCQLFLLQDAAAFLPTALLKIEDGRFVSDTSSAFLPLGLLLMLQVQASDYVAYGFILLLLVFLARETLRQIGGSHIAVSLALQLTFVVMSAVWFINLVCSSLSFGIVIVIAAVELLFLHRLTQPAFWRRFVKGARKKADEYEGLGS
ncbi:MAG: hypothetical protein HY303_19315 [Candidatus Wallbacteria bacterium]|nr:hypothetical protein [Candidatus Wallbacteria bacterium]